MLTPKILRSTLFSTGLALLLIGCNDSSSTTKPTPDTTEVTESKLTRELNPQATIEQQKELAKNNNDFAFDMFAKLQETQKGNLFFSPYSISEALVMTYAGAKGETKSQMATALHFDSDESKLHTTFNALDLHLNYNSDDYTLSVANSLWPQKDYTFLKSYLDTIKLNYGADLKLLDYANDTDGSRQTINRWVEEKTEDRIKNLIPKDSLSPLTRLVLVNAIYFKGQWIDKFEAYNTKDETFTLEDGSTITTPLMQQSSHFKYSESETYQSIELNYEGFRTSMVVVLPKEGLTLNLYNDIKESYNKIIDEATSKKVNLKLPKFEFATDVYNLKKPFKALGMIDAFGDNADFSAMTGRPELSIGKIVHKAFIKVDENGSEAAAATAVIMAPTSMPPVEEEPVDMFVNRPFIFFIKDRESGQILFMGVIKEPVQG